MSVFFKHLQGTAIGTKFAPPYAILFMSELEKIFSESSILKPYVWWRYIDAIFMTWQHGRKNLDIFLTPLTAVIPTSDLKQKVFRLRE